MAKKSPKDGSQKKYGLGIKSGLVKGNGMDGTGQTTVF